MYYFIREKVIVFNTNLKKVTVNGKKKKLFFLFLQHCAIISLPVTPFCHAKSHKGLSRSADLQLKFKPPATPLCKLDIE